MMNSPITPVGILSALVITHVMAAVFAQPAAAQTVGNLKCNGCVNSKDLKNNGIKSKDIKNGQVKNADLGSNAVTGGKIADGAVTGDKIVDGAVSAVKLADDVVTITAIPIDACTTINQPGAHVLTGNLTAAGSCIVLGPNASFVTIDLAGFALTGNGTGGGIDNDNNILQGVEVRNGTIRNFDDAVLLFNVGDCHVRGIRAVNNAGWGIRTSRGCIVADNVASDNGFGGIQAGEGTVVTGNTANRNGGDGIAAFFPGRIVVAGNSATGNGGDGFNLRGGSGYMISNNAANNNGGDGFDVACPSVLTGNVGVGNTGMNLLTSDMTCVVGDNNALP